MGVVSYICINKLNDIMKRTVLNSISRFFIVGMLLLGLTMMTTSCGSSRNYKKNPDRHKSMGPCGANVRY